MNKWCFERVFLSMLSSKGAIIKENVRALHEKQLTNEQQKSPKACTHGPHVEGRTIRQQMLP